MSESSSFRLNPSDRATGARWIERAAGDRIRLRKRRWHDPAPAWEVEGEVAASSADRLDVLVPAGTVYAMAGGERWRSDDDVVQSFTRGAWSHVLTAPAPAWHWYCNVTTPAVVRAGALEWTDLAVDVEVFPGGGVAVDDLPEFIAARAQLPADVFAHAVRAARRLLDDGAAERAPFRPPVGRAPASVEQKPFWLSPRAGDGLTAIGADVRARRPDVVARILAAAGPSACVDLGAAASIGLGQAAAPRDGGTVLAMEAELTAALESVRFMLQVWGPGAAVRLVVARRAPQDPRRDFEAALRHPARSLTLRLARALAAGFPPLHGFLTAADFVAAVWR